MKRLPTKEELKELIEQCTWRWTKSSGVNGYKVTGKTGNTIFLPASGFSRGIKIQHVGSRGYYWSSSVDDDYHADFLDFCIFYVVMYCYDYRYDGLSVRLVSEEDTEGFIDLGLSVRWATCNVGATKPDEYGNYMSFDEAVKTSKLNMTNEDKAREIVKSLSVLHDALIDLNRELEELWASYDVLKERYDESVERVKIIKDLRASKKTI